jgi:hypothetical protein
MEIGSLDADHGAPAPLEDRLDLPADRFRHRRRGYFLLRRHGAAAAKLQASRSVRRAAART